jgi:hypothetical protein
MKQHSVRAFVITVALIVGYGSLFADEITTVLESKPIALSMDKDADGKQIYGEWFVGYSKFATKGFPKIGDVPSGPVALYGVKSSGADVKSLGVAMLFDRKGYNWVDIVPGTKEAPKEIPIPGRAEWLSMWVWSGNFDYYLEAYVRDFKGVIHTLHLGDLTFTGWKSLRVSIPETVPQSMRYAPKLMPLTLVKFRIWTKPTEVVVIPTATPNTPDIERAVKFYFNNVIVLTDTFETLYDGDALENASTYKDAFGASE